MSGFIADALQRLEQVLYLGKMLGIPSVLTDQNGNQGI